MSRKQFAYLVRSSKTCGQVLAYFGFSASGNNWKTVKRRCLEEEVDTSHFDGRAAKRDSNTRHRIPLISVLVEHSTYNRASLKKRLMEEGLLKNECALCSQGAEWKGKLLILRLDHINGVFDDNRQGNLRLICPNCDSQLDTYGGRNRSYRRERSNCNGCAKQIEPNSSGLCLRCFNNKHPKKTKVIWPDLYELEREIRLTSKSAVARRLGVSETAVRKMFKNKCSLGSRLIGMAPDSESGVHCTLEVRTLPTHPVEGIA